MRAEGGFFFHGSPAPFFSIFTDAGFCPLYWGGGALFWPQPVVKKYIGETFPTKPVYNSIIKEIRSVYN